MQAMEGRKEGRIKEHWLLLSYRIELEYFGNLLMNGRDMKPFLKQKIYSSQH